MKNLKPSLAVALLLGIVSLLYLLIPSTFSKRYQKPSKKERIAQRFELEFEKTKDPALNDVPKDRLINARKYKDNLVKYRASIPGISWEERGPDNVGGRTRSLMFDPNDPTNKKVFAGSVGGGLWYNTNILSPSSPWTKVDDFWDNIAISALAYDPSNNNIFYAGTGEGFGNADAIRGDGVWKSEDAGMTWNQLSSTNDNSSFRYVKDISVLSNGDLIVATNTGLYKSTNGGTSFTNTQSGNVSDLEVASNGDLYAGIYSGKIYKSTNNGSTWTLILNDGNANRVEIAVAPSNANVIYAVANGGSGNTDISWIKKSIDNGSNWTNQSIPFYKNQNCSTSTTIHFTRSQAWYDLIINVDPSNENEIIVGGVDLHRSNDGGATWGTISYWTGNCDDYVHADIHEIINRPGNPNAIVVGCDGGVFFSADAYSAVNPNFNETNEGYNVTQFYATAIHPTAGSNYFLAGAQDNGTQKFSLAGINSTTEVTGGDGSFCHIDDNGTVQITSYIYNNYWVSTNGGNSWSSRNFNDNGRFINPTDYDSASKKLYCANTTGTYLRWDNPATGGSTTSTVTVSNFAGTVTYVYVSPNVANRVYFGFSNGTLVYVDDAHTGTSKTGTIVKGGGNYLNSLDIEKNNEDHMLLCYSNYGVISVYETIDGGASWTNVEGNLPDMPIRSVLINPINPQQALVGTELGVWTTDLLNGSATNWEPTNGGLANVKVGMLQKRASDNLIAAATHGRGLYTSASLNVPSISFNNATYTKAENADASGTTGSCSETYTQLNIPIGISINPSASVTVTVAVDASSTALNDRDYEVVNSSITFTDGGSLIENIVVNILDDAIFESNETIVLDLTVDGNSAGAVAGSTTRTTVTISDNDFAPGNAGGYAILLSEDFGSGIPTGWSLNDLTGGGDWQVADATTTYLYSGDPLASTTAGNGWVVFSSDGYGNDGIPEEAELILPIQNFGNVSNVKIKFQQFYKEYFGSSTYVDVSTDGTNYTSFDVMSNNTLANGAQTSNPENAVVDISSVADGQSTVYIKLRYTGNYDWWWQVDDLFIDGNVATTVEIGINESKTTYLANGETAHFYSDNGNIIASITQTSGSDIGCITAKIETEGTGQTPFPINPTFMMTNKSFNVEADNPSINYDIALYYSAAEMAIWGLDATELSVIKTTTPVGSATELNTVFDDSPTVVNLGNDYIYNSSFTNFSSFALTNATSTALPVELLSFIGQVKEQYNHLIWRTAEETNFSHFEIHRSFDGLRFEKIGQVEPGRYNYQFDDYELETNRTDYYYKLKMVDFDGQSKWSPIVNLRRDTDTEWSVYPNPVSDKLLVETNQSFDAYEIHAANGQRLIRAEIAGENFFVDFGKYPNGLYLLSMIRDGKLVGVKRVVKN